MTFEEVEALNFAVHSLYGIRDWKWVSGLLYQVEESKRRHIQQASFPQLQDKCIILNLSTEKRKQKKTKGKNICLPLKYNHKPTLHQFEVRIHISMI